VDRLEDVVRVHGHPTERLPNTLSIGFADGKQTREEKGEEEMKKKSKTAIRADQMLENIKDDVAASAGAACHSDEIRVSHVLSAMSVPKPFDQGTLRLSVGKMTTENEILHSAHVIATHIAGLISSRQ